MSTQTTTTIQVLGPGCKRCEALAARHPQGRRRTRPARQRREGHRLRADGATRRDEHPGARRGRPTRHLRQRARRRARQAPARPGGVMAAESQLSPRRKLAAGERRIATPAPTAISKARAQRLALLAKALADPVRIQLLDVLSAHPEPLCPCELLPLFDVSQPTLAHHLKVLRDAARHRLPQTRAVRLLLPHPRRSRRSRGPSRHQGTTMSLTATAHSLGRHAAPGRAHRRTPPPDHRRAATARRHRPRPGTARAAPGRARRLHRHHDPHLRSHQGLGARRAQRRRRVSEHFHAAALRRHDQPAR